MGVGASTAAGLENPFPIEPGLEKDLLRLSFVVSRLLNKPDLYDLNNLARPGACGDYAVFLKKKIERQLLSFVMDASGGTVGDTVIYGNPLKAFDTVEKRRAACSQLADTMVRLVSIVVACLASLQFESPRAREAAGVPAALPVQRGGAGEMDIIDWLRANRYVKSTFSVTSLTSTRIRVPLQDPGYEGPPPANAPTFELQLNRTPETDGTFTGYITAAGGRDYDYTGQPPMPAAGYLKVYFQKPIVIIPGTTTSILPLQVVDGTGMSWLCGVLFGNTFASLSSKNTRNYLFDILNSVFRKAQGVPADAPVGYNTRIAEPLEPRRDLEEADAVFNTVRRTRDSQPLLSALATFLSAIPGYRPFTPGAPGAPIYPPGAPGYYPAAPGYYPPVPAAPTGASAIAPLPRRPPTSLLAAAGTMPGELTAGEYVIPPPAAKTILTTFRKHAGEIGAANNPAQIRATLLAGQVLKNRTIQTRICQDPYWNAPTLAGIYPWATLQFLCLIDYRTLGAPIPAPTVIPAPTTAPIAGSAPVPTPALGTTAATSTTPRLKLRDEWGAFLTALQKIYNGEKVPRLTPVTGNQPLEDMRFLEVAAKTNGCATLPAGQSPRARFQEIQNGVLRLQGIYEEHSAAVWKLLNSLIILIADPDTKTDMVRLNPQIFSGGVSTSKFINEKATEAVALLTKYYVAVEETYTDTIRQMRIVD